jgi:endonuclease/exonuclease/phosphatase family metal-dependent hydrolase
VGRHAGSRNPGTPPPRPATKGHADASARTPVWPFALLASIALIACSLALVLRTSNETAMPKIDRAASPTNVKRPAQDAARGANRSAVRSYDVLRGVRLTPEHPAFYALKTKMTARGFVLRKSAKGAAATFGVSSFNVLGAGHTAGAGGYAPGPARMHGAAGLLMAHDVSVAGLQEFQEPQFHAFEAMLGGSYAAYPGLALGVQPVQNSIVWRRADWTLVEAHTMSVPYFDGNRVPMPYVKLRNVHSGQEVWFYNSHNPADAHGPAGHWRAIATSMESSLARQLTADGTPMIVTGDMNDREPFACPFSAGSGFHSADGVYSDASGCHMVPRTNVDWIFGSPALDFSSFVTDRSSQTRRISDHPFVSAQVTVPATNDPRCRRAPAGFGWFCPTH